MPTTPYHNAAVQEFERAITHLKEEFSRLQVGRANPSLVEHILVDAYGSMQPLKNMANISVPEPKTLQIQPWDKSVMSAIEKAIQASDLGLNPVNNGVCIMLNIPPLTEERRRDLAKVVHTLSEEARISIRNARQDAHSKFKSMFHDKKITEDDVRFAEKKLQEKVDEFNEMVGHLAKDKEEAIMKV